MKKTETKSTAKKSTKAAKKTTTKKENVKAASWLVGRLRLLAFWVGRLRACWLSGSAGCAPAGFLGRQAARLPVPQFGGR